MYYNFLSEFISAHCELRTSYYVLFPPCLEITYYVQKMRGIGLNGIQLKWHLCLLKKNQNPGGRFGATS